MILDHQLPKIQSGVLRGENFTIERVGNAMVSTTTTDTARNTFANHLRKNGRFPCHLRRFDGSDFAEMESIQFGFEWEVQILYHQGPVPLNHKLLIDLKFLEFRGKGDFGYRWTRDDILDKSEQCQAKGKK